MHDLQNVVFRSPQGVECRLRSDQIEVTPGDLEQNGVLDAAGVGGTAVNDLMRDERGKIRVADVPKQVHGGNGDGLRADGPVSAAKVDRLQVDLLDLTVAWLAASRDERDTWPRH